jgi:hypothetical protein
MYYLPWWMLWIQALGVIALSGIGAFIAYKQVRIATEKLNLDLYDRRFKVFDGARNLISKILQEGKPPIASIRLFDLNVADATFLFNAEVEKYLGSLRRRAVTLHTKTEQIREMDAGEQRNKLVDEIAELEMVFSVEYEKMVEFFRPYLKLGNI